MATKKAAPAAFPRAVARASSRSVAKRSNRASRRATMASMSRPAHPSPRMRAEDHLAFEPANLRQIQLFFLFFLFVFLRPGTGFGGGGFFHKQDQKMRGASRGGRPPRSANLPNPREPPPTATTRPSTKTFPYLGPPLDAPTALSDSLERRTDRAAPGRKPRSGWRSGQKDSLYLLLPG